MRTHKIGGPVLLGFSDFFVGDDEVGATKPAKPAPAKVKVVVKPYPKPARQLAFQHHGQVLQKAKSVALAAAKTLGNAQLQLAKKPSSIPKPPPGIVPTPAQLQGRMVHVGAAVAATMSPKAKLAVQKHNAAVVKAKQAAVQLAKHALTTKASLHKLAGHMVKQRGLSKKLRTPVKMQTAHVGELLNDPVIGEAVREAFDTFYTAIGATPDPANPGFLTDGTPDPAYGAVDPTTGMPVNTALSAADTTALTSGTGDDPADSGNLPAPPDMSAYIPDMTAAGGIAYDGSKGTPNGFAGSFGIMTKTTDNGGTSYSAYDKTDHYGYVYGSFDQEGTPNGIPYGGQGVENSWNHFHGSEQGPGTSGWHDVSSIAEAATSATKMAPNKKQYGPIVGNPGMKDFAAMRCDGAGNFFWLPQEAPDWLMFPIKQAAALTAQAAAKAASDAAAADAAAAAKAAADAATAQTAQDAANALSESQAASDAKVAQGTAETQAQQQLVQQAAADTAQQAVDTDQQKQAGALLIQQAQQQADQDKQVQDLLVQQAQSEQAYYAAHPDVDPSAADAGDDAAADDGSGDDGSGGDDDGGDDSDDGSGADVDVPGGDMMDDSDGEGFSEG